MTLQKPRTSNLSIVLIIFAIVATGLILVMAGKSRFNSHPDEHLHIKAAQYYTSYWLPPKVGDERSEYTYSYFGVSYLDDPDIIYLLAGKLSAVLAFTGLPPFLLARGVNFALFVVLFLLLLKMFLETGIPFYGILLLSPQIWYVFSYFNGDAFGFFVGTCLVLQLSRFIRDPEGAMPPTKIGLWLGLLILAKKNYYALIPVVAGVAVWHWIFYSKVGERRRLVKEWSKVIVVAMLIALPKIGYQEWVNGFDLSGRRVVQMEKIAAPGFKPSQANAKDSPWHVKMREKGRPFQDLLTIYQWHTISFMSMVGLYGWMDVVSPKWYYGIFFLLYALLFTRLCLPSRPLAWSELTLTVIGILGMAGSWVASFLNSWVVAFQAQGRYLFPTFCICFLLLAYKWERLPQKFFYWGFLGTGILSVGSFLFVALENALT